MSGILAQGADFIYWVRPETMRLLCSCFVAYHVQDYIQLAYFLVVSKTN